MRLAIIHDWLNGMRGGEKVLEALLELYPTATIYTLFHEPGRVSSRIEKHPIVTSWLNKVPGIYRHYRNLLPLFPGAIERLDLRGFDLIISSSHAVAKGIRNPGAAHVCYCHTPMRYVWDAEDDYSLDPLRSAVFGAVRSRLQKWDCEAAKRVDYFAANSRFVGQRIRQYYGREAEVIYPPVDTEFFTPSVPGDRGDFYLAVGALVPYKRVDLIIQAFKRLGQPLIVVGSGSELTRLRRMASHNIEVRGWVSNQELRRLYRRARGLVCAAREDFGITVVEAQACGCPVIAFGAGGAIETVLDGTNGVLFSEQDFDDIIDAVNRFERMPWSIEQVRSKVETFSREAFQTKIRKFIDERAGAKQEGAAVTLQPA
jgi:glycosyltransferase involved in cell wall biosynthesis